jgi:hypothetical protein
MKPEPPKLVPFPPGQERDAGALTDVSPDVRLNTTLRQWAPPVGSEELDARVLESYREWIDRKQAWRRRMTRWVWRAMLSAASVLALAVALWVVAGRQPLLVAELLAQSRRSDAALLSNSQVAVHRVYAYEERRVSDGWVIERRRVELWQRGGSRVTARRVFDARNRPVAGEWVRADGSRRIYNVPVDAAATPQIALPNGVGQAAILTSRQWWLMEPSAESFLALVPPAAAGQLVATRLASDQVVVTYRANLGDAGVEAADIVLRTVDYHPLAQSVRVRQDGESREFRVTEVAFEALPAATLADAVFEPDAALAGEVPPTKTPSPSAPRESRVSDAGLMDIEVDLLRRLDYVGALLGREAGVTRTPAGRVDVRALVDDDARKQELLRALEDAARSSAVDVDVRTFAEAASRETSSSSQAPQMRDLTLSETIAASDDLRRYFVNQTSDASGASQRPPLDEAIRRFASEALANSRGALLHAGAVRDLVARFSSAELASMTEVVRERWRSLVNAHAQEVQRQTAMLRLSLEPVFFQSRTVDGRPEVPPSTVADAAERLFARVVGHDEAVRAAFAVSSRTAGELEVRRTEFLRSLRAAEDLATEIERQR